MTTRFQDQNNVLLPVNSRSIVERTTPSYRSGLPSQVYEVYRGEAKVAEHSMQAEKEVDIPTAEEAQTALKVIMEYFELNPMRLSAGELITLEKFMERLHSEST